MNKTEFIQLIQTPELPSAKQVTALKQVVADFPYFTVSQVLLAKALFNEKHYEYEKYLKQTALAVPDREVLYNYLHNIKAEKQAAPVLGDLVKPVGSPVVPVEASVEQRSEPALTEEPEPADVEMTVQVEEVVEPVAEYIPEEVIEEEAQEIKEQTVSGPGANLQEPIREEIIKEEIQEPQEIQEQAPIAQHQGEEHSFMEWLQLAANLPVSDPAVEKPVVEKIVEPEPVVTSSATVPQPPTKEEIEKAVAKSNINDFGNILDKFIRENPSISRPKAEFFNPVNMARQSVEEDEELVTETLANLLYKQGNLKKAIRAYEKLCLLYPSKMTYFATLIQKIKTELKD